MLSTRIIGVINVLNNVAVQSINFNRYLPVGRPDIAISYLNKWGIDEIVVLDMKGSVNGSSKLHKYLPGYVADCQAPIAAGGGVQKLADIENLIRNGADKVVINSSAYNNPKIIDEGAREFGEQAIVVSVDIRREKNNYVIYAESGLKKIGMSLADALRQAQDHGAGEILVNSIDRDGSKKGYDLDLLNYVKDIISIPAVGCGGVGTSNHFLQAMPIGLSGLAAGNFFHYTEHSVIQLKSYLNQTEEDIRLDTYSNYQNREFALDERLLALSDDKLEALKFEYIPEENI